MLPCGTMRASTFAAPLLVLLACRDPAEPDPCVLRAAEDCDVRELECQEHVHAVLACVREAEHPLPTIELLTPEQYAADNPPPPPRTAEEQRRWEQLTRAYKLLGWLPQDWTEPEPAAVTPPYLSYDVETDTLTVVADGREPGYELYGLLYTLALADRDRESDLQGLFLTKTGTFDRERALVTLSAGEATFYADLAWHRDPDFALAARSFSYDDAMSETLRRISSVGSTWGEAMASFQYNFGANYVLHAYLDGGPEAVTAAYDEAIASTAYALGGGDSDIIGEFAEIDAPLPDPPPGFRYLVQNNFGPVMLLVHGSRASGGIATDYEKTLASGWVGDRLVIAGHDTTDAIAVVWHVAGPGGEIFDTILLASDDETLQTFQELFPGA